MCMWPRAATKQQRGLLSLQSGSSLNKNNLHLQEEQSFLHLPSHFLNNVLFCLWVACDIRGPRLQYLLFQKWRTRTGGCGGRKTESLSGGGLGVGPAREEPRRGGDPRPGRGGGSPRRGGGSSIFFRGQGVPIRSEGVERWVRSNVVGLREAMIAELAFHALCHSSHRFHFMSLQQAR